MGMCRAWAGHGQGMGRAWAGHGQGMGRAWAGHEQGMGIGRVGLGKAWAGYGQSFSRTGDLPATILVRGNNGPTGHTLERNNIYIKYKWAGYGQVE